MILRGFCMLRIDVNFDYIAQKQEAIERLLTTYPETRKKLNGYMQYAVISTREEIVKAAGNAIKNDPRGAAKAVKTTSYKRVLGGNVSLYNSRKAHGTTSYEPPRKGSTGRGGNRLARNEKTARIMSYDSLDRGFVLRWINAGMTKTPNRSIKFTPNGNRHEDKWNRHPNTGNRGSIAAQNFFRTAGAPALAMALDKMLELIENYLQTLQNEKQ